MCCCRSCHNKLRYVPLIIYKTDSVTGASLSGAVFELTASNGYVCTGTTNTMWMLSFCILPCNTYTLKEVSPPSGYAPADHIYTIDVDACGRIFVDGVLASQIIVTNTAISASFTAVKVNSENGLPLVGAAYTLYSGALPVANTVSTEAGAVMFTNLTPGTYELVETAPPAGYQANTDRLPVVVALNGSVTILGESANGYRLNNVPLII